MAGRLDARAKAVAAVIAAVAVSSTPPGAWTAFAAYAALVVTLAVTARVSARKMWQRLRLGAPFVLMAAALLALSGDWIRGAAIVLKGLLVLAILAILVETTATTSLIGAIRKLGAPHSVNLVASLMLRYIAMLNEEFGRMSRARLARAGGPLAGVALFEVHGNQVGLLLIRSWERAERIHRAMLSRGFDGTMPDLNESRFAARDAIAATAVAGAFTGVRLALGGLGL